MKKLWSIALVLILAIFLAACSSDDNTTEAPEENNNEASETNEESNDSNETSGSDVLNLAVVEAITAEWALTGHASTDSPLNYAGTRDGCQPCHSGNGFAQLLTDNPFTPQADEEAGEDVELPRTMDCATCHTGVGQEILATGVTPAEYVPFMHEDFDVGQGSALCIACHNGRRDTGDMFEQWASGEGQPTAYPHYDAGALYSGKGGMEYPDANYANTAVHQSEGMGCVGCHMPETEDGYVSHNFSFSIDDVNNSGACASCHGPDLSIGGDLQAELDELLEELHELAVAAVDGAVSVGKSRLTFPFEDANGERVDLDNVSLEAFVGAYNYYLIYADKSGGAHNPAYAKSLLQESINRLK